MNADMWINADRRAFIGGSDARIVMGDDEPALIRLWREKRGEVEKYPLTPGTFEVIDRAFDARRKRPRI